MSSRKKRGTDRDENNRDDDSTNSDDLNDNAWNTARRNTNGDAAGIKMITGCNYLGTDIFQKFPGFMGFDIGHRRFYYDQSPSTYDEAVESCEGNGGQLVEIRNEDQWVKVKTQKPFKNYFVCSSQYIVDYTVH